MGLLLLLHVVLVAAAVGAPAAQAWGKEGHYMTCKIADGFLTKEALAGVKALLPSSAKGELAEVCSWADNQRFRYRWSSPLHFADTPKDCKFSYARDCHDAKGNKDACVVGAINNYTAALQDPSSPYDRTESLMFLAHFVGDVHQPLHCGHVEDLGGNTILVRWYRRKSNLHHVWDVDVIEQAMKDFYGKDQDTMIKAIQRNITKDWSGEEKQWEACRSKTKTTCADKYAQESAALACDAYKGVKQDSALGDEYYSAALPVVEKRIAQGGVRLAAILNRIFSRNGRLQSI
ncbi:endonuclease 4-like [Triticum dicoccoides]|uniref:endonuclease 4-like n=1 Tax=Triticum dicoccoides TaxID=85692 RepID=UPI00188FF678|nr:endonuclease 4-like [Triticum dicoccoides]